MSSQAKYFNIQDHDSDNSVGLKVEDTTFWVPKEMLASISPYFSAMFNGNFVESASEIINLHGKTAADIDELLQCIIPTPNVKSIDESNVDLLISLSDEYQIKELHDRAVSFLMAKLSDCKSGDLILLDILRLATKHGIRPVLEQCLRRCAWEFELWHLDQACMGLPEAISNCIYLYKKMMQLNPTKNPRPHECQNTTTYCKWCNYYPFCYECTSHWCRDSILKSEAKRMMEIVKSLLDNM